MVGKLDFYMPFEATTIEHLGLRLYSTLPPVISELVSNSYDADAPKVDIVLPEGPLGPSSEVVLRDYGHGMDAHELQDEYLPIGRNRRGRDSKNVMSKSGRRRVTGRKGLGKLSAFGVASEIEITAYRAGQTICLILNYEDMKNWAETHTIKEPYKPSIVNSQTGPTKERDGLEVRLRQLHRKSAIDEDSVRKGLAKRLRFIGSGFEVFVNNRPIGPGDRVQRGDASEAWDVSELPHGSDVAPGLPVSGWLGFAKGSSQTERGIDVFANGKAVELGSFFNYPSTHAQFARAHLIGEVHADFLDSEQDLIATARNSVVWESEGGIALQEWGRATLKWAFGKWVESRKQKKEEQILRVAGFEDWLKGRQPSEQKVAQRMVRLLVDDPDLEPSSAVPLLEIVKSSVESVAFRELIEAIEDQGTTASTLLSLFQEWRVIEAREYLRLADGRLEAMEKLNGYLKAGALEVQQMQPLFEQNLWLVDPAWTEANGQTRYTQLLREHCKEPKDYEDLDRRLDLLGVRSSSELCVLELKRPEKTLSRRDLEQIEKYVDWARSQFEGSGPDAPRYVRGLLVVGQLSTMADVQRKQTRLAGSDIRVETYADLLTRARDYYGQVERVLKAIAPEYSRSRRKAAKRHK
ncbi:MAG: ATP-binding protein [Candidatus Eisenbacteria bacterium]